MTSAALVPAGSSDSDGRSWITGDVVCVSSSDEVHDILESMRCYRIPRVLVAGPDGGFVGVLEQDELLPFEDDPLPRRLDEVVARPAGAGDLPAL
jgi:predicted transcriptional regulator